MKKEDIKNLDDMAKHFFEIAREIGHPLKNINLELQDVWDKK